ncbi:MAG: alpha/beta hydrolase [Fuerstiella sp.]|nr:alpha/beta hydrolase [Fuerstiella sp.]MCP4854178.1 alpha/beta hydrolase [Fuerstiella sp.]
MLVDFRGHGNSDRGHGYAVTDYVDDICNLIHDRVPGPVALYGHSPGAMTVAGVAARLGHQVSAIVMEDPPLQSMGTRISSWQSVRCHTTECRFSPRVLSLSPLAAPQSSLSPSSHHLPLGSISGVCAPTTVDARVSN